MFETVQTPIKASAAPLSGTGRHGQLVWSAQIPKDPETGTIVEGDIQIQARRALGNLALAMEAAGGSLSDVTCVQVSITDPADAKPMNEVWREIFSAPYPVRTTVVVAGLLSPGVKLELLAQAVVQG